MILSGNGLPHSNEKGKPIASCNNMKESHKLNIGEKKQVQKTLSDSIYVTFQNGQNSSVMIEVEIMVILGQRGNDWKGVSQSWECSILDLVLVTCEYSFHENSRSCMLTIHML